MKIRTRILRRIYRSRLMQAAFFNPVVEYHQWRLNAFVRRAAAAVDEHQVVVDVGAGELKYRTYFEHCHYVSSDLCVGDADWDYRGVDVLASAYALPLRDESVDAVLCIQVLEHLDSPQQALCEFHRVLSNSGRAYLSVPLLAGEHQQPFDFFRYTRYGLTELAKRAGFSVDHIAPHGGSFIALETLFWATFWGVMPFRRQSLARYAIYFALYPLKVATGVLALCLDPFDREKSATINYDVVLTKRTIDAPAPPAEPAQASNLASVRDARVSRGSWRGRRQ